MKFLNNPDIPIGSEGSSCPHLGMKRDPSTALAYPSEWNLCYHCRSLDAPRLAYQRKHCLTGSHHLCPFFAGGPANSLPEGVRMQQNRSRRWGKKNLVIVVLALGVISVGGVYLRAQYISDKDVPPGLVSTNTLPAGFSLLDPQIHSPTITAYASPTLSSATNTPQPSVTPRQGTEIVISSMHGLDMPIGTSHLFVIHRMLQGESLFTMATMYNTSIEAIKNVNYNMPDPVWVDWLVIIPVDTSDVSGLPTFEAYLVVEGGVSIEWLAEILKLDTTSLKFYNGLENDYLLSDGEWLLLPHTGE